LVSYVIVHLHQTIVERSTGYQVHWHVAVASRDQRNPIPDEHRDHTDDELVDRLRIEERGDELTAAHQPDVLAGLVAQPAGERTDRTAHERAAPWDIGWRRPAGEDDGRTLRVECCAHAEAHLIGLPSEQLGVDGPHEGIHAIEAFGSGTGRQPLEIA